MLSRCGLALSPALLLPRGRGGGCNKAPPRVVDGAVAGVGGSVLNKAGQAKEGSAAVAVPETVGPFAGFRGMVRRLEGVRLGAGGERLSAGAV